MSKVLKLPVRNKVIKHVYAFLNQTKQIDTEVINLFIKNQNLYEDIKYNCVFVGYNCQGQPRYGYLQGTNTAKPFAEEVYGSDREIGLFVTGVNQNKTLIVAKDILEGLSLMTIIKNKGRNLGDYAYLMLGDTEQGLTAIEYHLAHNPELETIVMTFNNNDFLKEIGFQGKVIEYYPRHQNFNKDLTYKNKFEIEMRNYHERSGIPGQSDAGILSRDGRTPTINQGERSKATSYGQIRPSDHRPSSGERQGTLFGITNSGEPEVSRDVSAPGRRSQESISPPQTTAGRTRASRENRRLYGESGRTAADLSGSGQRRDAGDRTAAHVENYYAEATPVNYGGAKTKYQQNIAAIKLLKKLESLNRLATMEEQSTLARYTGFGGIAQAFDLNNEQWRKEATQLKELLTPEEYQKARASTPNAHYTSPEVITAIYQSLARCDFTEGKILEPSMGIGNFFAYLPEQMRNSQLCGIELDDLSGRIAKQLFPRAEIQITGFENTQYPDNYFDLIIGNIPFGNYQVYDPKYQPQHFLIHDYFLAKAIDQVKPHGLVVLITTKGTLDKADNSLRRYLAQKAELLGAVRLPQTAFREIAHTNVTTDLLFFQKYEHEMVNEPPWLHLGFTAEQVPVNQYYLDNPQMLLGTMVYDRSMYGNQKSTSLINEDPDFNLKRALTQALDHIKIESREIKIKEREATSGAEQLADTLPADPHVKNFTYTLVDGVLYYRENQFLKKTNYTGTKLEKAKQLHGMRQALRKVINLQIQPQYQEIALINAQKELEKIYDQFVAQYGYLNDKNNQAVFEEDLDHPLLLSLENRQADNTYTKAPVFHKATIRPKEQFQVETARDALILSLNRYSRVDLAFMAEISLKEPIALVEELAGQIFLNPAKYQPQNPYRGYETAEEYLSGNVKEKLALAKEADPEVFAPNVAALEKVQPEDLEIYEIGYKLGSNWIPVEMYQEFIFQILETPAFLKLNDKNSIRLFYNQFNTAYIIYNKNNDNSNLLVTSKFGTTRRNAYEILEDTLNFKASNVYEVVLDPDGKERRVLNAKETQLARAKQEVLKNEFINWILQKEARIATLEEIYNRQFNVYVPRHYDGKQLIMPSLSDNVVLRPYQKDTAMRILLGGNLLIAHEVGAGKTFTMATGAMLLKEAGVAKKPLFVVPNHLVKQWGNQFLALYPTANLLVPNKKDFETKNRQKFIAKIATGEYDAVILSFTQFEKIPMSLKYVTDHINSEIEEITAAIQELEREEGGYLSVKQYEIQKKNLEVRLHKISDTTKKDKVLTFEELGIDYLFVDEAHYYKNCFVHTKMTNVAGVATSNAQKSFDMLMKTRYLTAKNHGRGVVFATGTPVTNSIAETYIMQRYLQEATLKKAGIRHFDQWASVFGEITTALELAPTGTSYRLKTRFSKFYNMPELLKMFNQCSDFKSVADLGINRPEIVGGKPETMVVPPSAYVLAKMQELEKRAERIKYGYVNASSDNMLKITMEGKSVAIDPRLVDPEVKVGKKSKIYACCEKVAAIYQQTQADKALQLVFLDYGIQLYEVMKQELIEQGITAHEIAFISDAKNDKQKEALFAKCRNGQVRVLFGSTAKMGAGTNVQDRMIALHHVDCPWRPADLEQRNGRIRRHGNRYEKVHIFQYVTEGTFDSYLYQIQEKKQAFISQIMGNNFSKRNFEDLDQTVLEYAEVKALCCGDPRIKEKADLDNEIQWLQIEKNAHLREEAKLKRLLDELPRRIENIKNRMSKIESDLQQLQERDQVFKIVLGEHTYTERKGVGEVFGKIINNLKVGRPQIIGNYRGLDLIAGRNNWEERQLTLAGAYELTMKLSSSGQGSLRRIDNLVPTYQNLLEDSFKEKQALTQQLNTVKTEIGKPFAKEVELAAKLERQAELTCALELKETQEVIINEKEEEESGQAKRLVPLEDRPELLEEVQTNPKIFNNLNKLATKHQLSVSEMLEKTLPQIIELTTEKEQKYLAITLLEKDLVCLWDCSLGKAELTQSFASKTELQEFIKGYDSDNLLGPAQVAAFFKEQPQIAKESFMEI